MRKLPKNPPDDIETINLEPGVFAIPDIDSIRQELDDILNPSATDDLGNTRKLHDSIKTVVKFVKGDKRLTSIDYRETGGKTTVTILINGGKIRSEKKYKEVMDRLRKAMDF